MVYCAKGQNKLKKTTSKRFDKKEIAGLVSLWSAQTTGI
jgi:hypothetical protein